MAAHKDTRTTNAGKARFHYLEEAIDHCEDTVNLIEAALVKNP